MKIKVKVLYDEKYKTGDHFDEAIERWGGKGWILADMVNSFEDYSNAAIIYLVERKEVNHATIRNDV